MDVSGLFRFRLNKRFLDYMAEYHIKTTYEDAPSRWIEGNEITSSKFARMHPHTSSSVGHNFINQASFSYSHSSLHPHVMIGRYCSVSWNVQVMGIPHPTGYLSTSPLVFDRGAPFKKSIEAFGGDYTPLPLDLSGGLPIEIGHDVWVGQNVLLSRKARLGTGCVIGAGSVVTGSVPPYAIFGGAPARLIRYRFDSEIIAGLLESRWWEYALPQMMHLPVNTPKDFLHAFQKAILVKEIEPYTPETPLVYDLVRSFD